MEEEKKQQEGFAKKAGDKLKKGAKNQAKKAVKEVFKKIIKALAPILLKLLIILIIAIIVLEAISWVIDLFTSSESKNASANAIQYSYSSSVSGEDGEDGEEGEEEDKQINSQILVDINNVNDNGAYVLQYKFFDDKENEISEDNAIKKLKKKLSENDIEEDSFNDSELKIITVLLLNGLPIEDYTVEELKCIALFIKADIANTNFDLRPSEKTGEEIDIEDIMNSDEVYGTLKVRKTKVVEDAKVGTKYDVSQLEFLKYDDFKKLVNNDNMEAIKYFSLNEEGQLVIAKWHIFDIEETYLDESGDELSETDIARIPDENKTDSHPKTTIRESQPINYKSFINMYTVNYGLLTDLLLTTDNVDFCKDVAKLAFNNMIYFNVKEQLTHTHRESTMSYTETKLIRDYIDYNVRGQEKGEISSYELVTSGVGAPTPGHGWNSSLPHSTADQGRTAYYQWTYNKDTYMLVVKSSASGNVSWFLYRAVKEEGEIVEIESGNSKPINIFQERGVGYYTQKDEFKYKIKTIIDAQSNTYKFEIDEIDGWFLKYKKEYTDPEIQYSPMDGDGEELGEYSEEERTEYIDKSIIEADEHVQNFIEDKEKKYEDEYESVECSVIKLAVGVRTKEDYAYEYDTQNDKYKFGEEKVETTDVKLKNVILTDNTPTYTEKNEEGELEIGFLYLYNKYMEDKVDLFLKQDAEMWLFDLLEHDSSTKDYSTIIRYLLYAYDEVDRGITELDLSIFKPKEILTGKFGGSALAEWLKSYENEWLREYRNGTASDSTIAYCLSQHFVRENIETGETEYGLEELNAKGDHSLNYSYGMRVYGYEPGGEAYLDVYAPYFIDAGVEEDIHVLVKNSVFFGGPADNYGWASADALDRVQLAWLKDKKDYIKTTFENKGITLEPYELDALVGVCYAYGNCGETGPIFDLIKKYKSGEITPEQFKKEAATNKGAHFFTNNTTGRAEEYWLMFHDNIYQLSTGEIIDPDDFLGGLMGVTTQAEAEKLCEQFNEMVGAQPGGITAAQQYSGVFPEFWCPGGTYNNCLEPFQCTWWAVGRANMYLSEYGTKYTSYPLPWPNGGQYYATNWAFDSGEEPRVNSLLSKASGSEYGHVAYVEGVTDEGIWVSEAGSGSWWGGINFYSYDSGWYQQIYGFVYLDSPL